MTGEVDVLVNGGGIDGAGVAGWFTGRAGFRRTTEHADHD